MTSDVGKDLGSLQTELADCFTILAGLLRGCRACEFDIIGAKLVQSLSYLDLLGRVEVGICELLALPQCALDDLKLGNIAQEVADGEIRVFRV